jgi:hypothetical protein
MRFVADIKPTPDGGFEAEWLLAEVKELDAGVTLAKESGCRVFATEPEAWAWIKDVALARGIPPSDIWQSLPPNSN